MAVRVKAAAKINLYLDILARLDNGYHSLFMLMQSIDLYDVITVETAPQITIACSDADIPSDKANIAHKAATAFFNACGIDGGAKIYIEKNIPSAAGLAGGSADGAAVIAALNKLYDTNLTETEMCKIGVKVGADIPFCLTGGTRLAQDIGGVLSDLPPLPDCFFVLAKPSCGVSTREAYSAFDSCENIRHPSCVRVLNAAATGNLNGIIENCGNVFEQFVEVPERIEIKKIMRKHNSLLSQMSGSGPTVFGIFTAEQDATTCANELKNIIKDVFICRPIGKGLTF